jgi:MoaA/NifB/PqqE/SkfB family radical SAM enzyme
MWRETDPRLLWTFCYNFGWKGMQAVNRFKKRLRQGRHFPAFLFVSVTTACNLRCQGCWVSTDGPRRDMAPADLDRLIRSAKKEGCFFFGILGGEPLLYGPLFQVLGNHPDCYFVLFTNGTLLTREVAKDMRRLGNVSPLISIEGLERVSDERRGGSDVYGRTRAGLEACRQEKLVIGVATSLCKTNLDDLTSDRFVNEMVRAGAHYLWYYLYRPSGPNPCPELGLSPEEILRVRQFLVDIRTRAPIVVVDAYWDHDGKALCPAATGIGHHVSAEGFVEPCPPVQLAAERWGEGCDLVSALEQSRFLREFRETASRTTRGCVLLERPDLLSGLLSAGGVCDSSGRNSIARELAAMTCKASHHLPGREIPEKSWAYRFAKRNWFFGFGAYG